MSSIGSKVKHYRKERGFSQGELAEGICSRQTISLLENDMHVPSAWMLQKIAEKAGIPLPEVLSPFEKTFDDKLTVEILKVYVASANYVQALVLVEELEDRRLVATCA